MIKVIVTFFIIIGFSACSIKDVSKPVVKYTISDEIKTIKADLTIDKVLEIEKLKAPKSIQNNHIWYEKATYAISPYLYSSWNCDFVEIIDKNIADSVYSSGLFKSTFSNHSKVRSDLVLEGEIVEAIQRIDTNGEAYVSFIVREYLIDHKTFNLIGSKEFKYTQKCETVDAKGAIMAYNKIVKKLNKDVVLWLKILVKES